MKNDFERALKAKQDQRKANAARPIAEKFKVLDRLKERSTQMKSAKRTGVGSRSK